jgi:hypothetical protein
LCTTLAGLVVGMGFLEAPFRGLPNYAQAQQTRASQRVEDNGGLPGA